MTAGKILLVILLAGTLGILAGLFTHWHEDASEGTRMVSPGLLQSLQKQDRLPPLSLPDLDGTPVDGAQWAGKVRLFNFWATWCEPCQREMALLMELQRTLGPKGLQIVGIAIDDPEAVRAFVARRGLDYPVLVGGEDAIELSRTLGNRIQVLPFSVLVDRDGRLLQVQIGELKRATLEEWLRPLSP